MAHAAFEQDIFVSVPPEMVSNFLAAMQNHPQIHPLIVAITPLDPTTGQDGRLVQRYHIRDRMRLGPFTLAFTYLATLQTDAPGELHFEAFQFPRIRLSNTTRCLPEGTGTRVSEQVQIEAPRLLMRTVFQQARQSHHHMLLNLKRHLEAAQATASAPPG